METAVGLDLKDSLKQYFGFSKFKGEQEAIMKSVLDGNDTFVIMPTGGGKSLCYQLPALLTEGTTIVVSLTPRRRGLEIWAKTAHRKLRIRTWS